MIRMYAKGSPESVGKNWIADEFDCPCKRPECDHTLVDDTLVTRLDALCDIVGGKPTLTSGHRCHAHQADLAKSGFPTTTSPISTHEEGMAADFKLKGLTGLELEVHARKAGFTSVGVAEGWIHADTRPGMRSWKYPPPARGV